MSMYIRHEDLRLWPHGSRICTYSLDSVLKQPDCSSERRDSLERLRVLTDKNVDDICNVMKNVDGMPDRWQQVSVIAQESLKLAIFLFHHQWRYTFDWKVMVLCEDTVCLLAGQKRLKDKYNY